MQKDEGYVLPVNANLINADMKSVGGSLNTACDLVKVGDSLEN